MDDYKKLFEGQPEAWISGLPTYQRRLIEALLAQGNSADEAAEKWLSAVPKDTFPFGGVPSAKPYLNKLLDELEALLCGDPKYTSERAKLALESKPTHALFVSTVAVLIAPAIGTSAPVLAPVIALLLATIAKLGLNAWCAVRKESREKQLSDGTQK
jgi:hypothetical protein